MIQLPSKFYKELDILQNHIILRINQYDWDILERCRKTIQDTLDENKKYIFLYEHETISDLEYLDELYKIIEYFKIDACISTSTTSTFPRSTHPLTNFLMWRNVNTRKNISWNSQQNIPIFDESFYYGKKVEEDREYKGILSVRKENEIRDYLFNKNPNIDGGIVRYAKWPHNGENLIEDNSKINNYPLLNELIDEYKNSYFSFIVESEHGDSNVNPTTNLTEKTLIGLLTGTMPIILGGKGIISDLEKLGITVWNNEFGFGEGDSYTNYSEFKIDSFIRCIENVNKLSLTEVKEYYNKNIKLIQSNYDLISYILFDDKFKLE
jgi:hypothetical protein